MRTKKCNNDLVMKQKQGLELDAVPGDRISWLEMSSYFGDIEWSWKNWLPKGLLTILASDPGIGKSAIALRMAQTFIQGCVWPDGTSFSDDKGSVLWCEAESAEAINISRAASWKIPMEYLLSPLNNIPPIAIKLDREDHRNALKVQSIRNDIKLVIIDSLRGIHGGEENSSDIIQVLMWLAELARDIQKPVLLTHHLRKKNRSDSNVVTLDRLRGSTAIVQPARMVWALDTPDPTTPNNKRLSVIKSNIARFPDPLGFSITGTGIVFGSAPQKPKANTVIERAKFILLDILNKGPLVASEILEQLIKEGVSKNTVYRARKELGLVQFHKGKQVYWSILPCSDDEFD